MDNLENSDILAKWLAGKLSKEEEAELLLTHDLNDLKMVLNDIDTWKVPERDVNAGLKELLNKVRQRKQKEARVISMRRWVSLAAAVVIVLGGYWLYRFVFASDMMHLETGANEQFSYTFPDGSVVEMDAMTTIDYDQAKWEQERSMKLKGTALFKVIEGQQFTVKTGYGEVRVLGTVFNVRTGDELLSVNCYEGAVRVKGAGMLADIKANETVTLFKGQLTRDVSVGSEPDWKQGFTEFKEASLEEVVEALNQRYQMSIQLPEQYKSIRFTGKFVNDNLEQALKMVFAPTGIHYTLNKKGEVEF